MRNCSTSTIHRVLQCCSFRDGLLFLVDILMRAKICCQKFCFDSCIGAILNVGSDAPVCAASLLIGMNDSRSTKSSRERSDSPFTFPRQRRSVRPRLYLSIDSDSE